MAEAPGTTQPPIRSWDQGLAPSYIALFLWVGFFDQLAGTTLAIGGLAWSALGAATAGLLCYQLLYYVPAMWGHAARRPLAGVAQSTFGTAGAHLVPGALMGLVQIGWLAVATYYATDFTLKGLAVGRLIDPRLLDPIAWRGVGLRSPLFLSTALAWTFAFASVGAWAVRLIEAIMRVFPVFPALLLGAAMVWGLGGLENFAPTGFDPVTAEPVENGGPRAALTMIQLVFAFFATAGAAAADWGAAARDRRDVRLGGLVGVAMGATVLAVVALATVAGTLGRRPLPQALAVELEPLADLKRLNEMQMQMQMHAAPQQVEKANQLIEKVQRDVRAVGASPFSFGTAVGQGIGGRGGAAILLIFGLGSMAPAVYASHLIGVRFSAAWPTLSRTSWTMLGATASLPIVATGLAAHTGVIFGVLGAAFAPVVGALAADYVRRKGRWAGPRRGANLAGWLAWAIGLAVGLAPWVGPALGKEGWARIQPAAVLAFLAAFVSYSVLAAVGCEPPVVADSDGGPTVQDQAMESVSVMRSNLADPSAHPMRWSRGRAS